MWKCSLIGLKIIGWGMVGMLFLTATGCEYFNGYKRGPDRHAAMIVVNGRTVPNIGRLPTAIPVPPGNLNYEAKILLGKQLFFDDRLSKGNAISCAFCHNPGTGWADRNDFSRGVTGQLGDRQAPTVLNTGFNPFQFWDGRVGSLEEQALLPIINPIEMAETHENVVRKLSKLQGYRDQFQAVFGTVVNIQGVGEAIAAYERTIISKGSAFDKFVLGDESALSKDAKRGRIVFTGKARCIHCHNGPNFTDNQFHNLGVPQVGTAKTDKGRFNVTLRKKDTGAFKTPTLRSISETSPYMHDGVFKTLEDVVKFYNKGGGKNKHLDSLIKPLGLTSKEITYLIAFLNALTGEPIPFEFPDLPK